MCNRWSVILRSINKLVELSLPENLLCTSAHASTMGHCGCEEWCLISAILYVAQHKTKAQHWELTKELICADSTQMCSPVQMSTPVLQPTTHQVDSFGTFWGRESGSFALLWFFTENCWPLIDNCCRHGDWYIVVIAATVWGDSTVCYEKSIVLCFSMISHWNCVAPFVNSAWDIWDHHYQIERHYTTCSTTVCLSLSTMGLKPILRPVGGEIKSLH